MFSMPNEYGVLRSVKVHLTRELPSPHVSMDIFPSKRITDLHSNGKGSPASAMISSARFIFSFVFSGKPSSFSSPNFGPHIPIVWPMWVPRSMYSTTISPETI